MDINILTNKQQFFARVGELLRELIFNIAGKWAQQYIVLLKFDPF